MLSTSAPGVSARRLRTTAKLIAGAWIVALLSASAPAAPPASASPPTADSGRSSVSTTGQATGPRTVLTGADFDPGEIISDENFYDANALSEAGIQAFFASKPCTPNDGVPCLADFRKTTKSIPAAEPGHCDAYRGAANESAARIVWKVAHACGINPAVLLVLMEKEQSLVTAPGDYGYARAMGWGCPDTGPDFTANCDANYFGFQNQVYKSAWQFRQYTLYPINVPGESRQRAYHVGPVFIQYSPDESCGGTEVKIKNQATANLYLYTPYQPNAAALANLHGTGDACSAYGNRNFWLLYTDWFGPAVS